MRPRRARRQRTAATRAGSPEAIAPRASSTTPIPATATYTAAKRVESGPVQGLKNFPNVLRSSWAAPELR